MGFRQIRCADHSMARRGGTQVPSRVFGIDVASDIARHGVFLIPQGFALFSYSGQRNFLETAPSKYVRFRELTGIELESNCGIDTSATLADWQGVSVMTEIVLADFTDVQQARAEGSLPHQAALFAAA
jgi:hypothetical protein